MSDYKEEVRPIKKFVWWIIGIVALISVVMFALRKTTEAAHIKDAVIVYEEYQEIFNTCEKLNTDLCNMKEMPDDDKMFDQFSKAQRLLAIQTNLNRWIEEYNAKSKMWGRSLWKSKDLPYQLSNSQFPCNN